MAAATPKKLCVTVLAGGPSAEREVSLASGQAVAEALRRRGHDVLLADIGPDNLATLDHAADVVFPALHGTFGEDGTIQRIMEEHGIRFVGSGSRASALAIDKVATKQLAADLGIPTPAYEVVTPPGEPTLPLPVMVKPIAQGSSVGTTIVRDARELTPTVQAVAGTYGRALVERFVPGDELTVGILGEQTLPPICIQPNRDFYDYEAKYRDEHTEYLFETGHSSALLERVSALSRSIFEALDCRHLARVDWMVESDGRPWFLEVNTLPGFTSHSLVPKAAERVGIPFDELVEQLIRMALEDHS
jgi:D-alanine-D-alanine ligase